MKSGLQLAAFIILILLSSIAAKCQTKDGIECKTITFKAFTNEPERDHVFCATTLAGHTSYTFTVEMDGELSVRVISEQEFDAWQADMSALKFLLEVDSDFVSRARAVNSVCTDKAIPKGHVAMEACTDQFEQSLHARVKKILEKQHR